MCRTLIRLAIVDTWQSVGCTHKIRSSVKQFQSSIEESRTESELKGRCRNSGSVPRQLGISSIHEAAASRLNVDQFAEENSLPRPGTPDVTSQTVHILMFSTSVRFDQPRSQALHSGFCLAALEKNRSCETKSGTESLGTRLALRVAYAMATLLSLICPSAVLQHY